MAEHPTQPEMLADLHESQQALLTFLDQVDDTTLYRRFIAEEWTLAENLVHVAEARQFLPVRYARFWQRREPASGAAWTTPPGFKILRSTVTQRARSFPSN